MKIINDFDKFVEGAVLRGKAISTGDYKTANKLSKKLHDFYIRIKDTDGLNKLAAFLNHENENVRYYAAIYYLKYDEEVALTVLEELTKLPTIISTSAKMTLEAWRKGLLDAL